MASVLFSVTHRKLWFSIAMLVVVIGYSSAQAIVINNTSSGTSNPAQNGVAPTTTYLAHGDPGWNNVGTVNGGSCVYLGNGWVLTANHLVPGGATGRSVNLNGTVYTQNAAPAVNLHNPNSSVADLTLFRLSTIPVLTSLDIAITSPTLAQQVVMIGNGYTRNSNEVVLIDVAGPNDIYGYTWSATKAKGWGTNSVSDLTSLRAVSGANSTMDFLVNFDRNVTGDAQAASGDSGGAAFSFNTLTNQWELTGIMLAVDAYSNQPANSSAYGTHTLIADLSLYQAEIQQIIAVPEPATLGLLAIGGLTLLARKRR